jgi:hypothetical protein
LTDRQSAQQRWSHKNKYYNGTPLPLDLAVVFTPGKE